MARTVANGAGDVGSLGQQLLKYRKLPMHSGKVCLILEFSKVTAWASPLWLLQYHTDQFSGRAEALLKVV